MRRTRIGIVAAAAIGIAVVAIVVPRVWILACRLRIGLGRRRRPSGRPSTGTTSGSRRSSRPSAPPRA